MLARLGLGLGLGRAGRAGRGARGPAGGAGRGPAAEGSGRGLAGTPPGAAVRVAAAEGFGRGLWAAQALRAGERVLEESPVASSPPAGGAGGGAPRVCWGCLRALGARPGAEVGGRAFCGEPCAAEARRWSLGRGAAVGAEERRFEELCGPGGAGTLPLLALRLARACARGRHAPAVLDPLCFADVPAASSEAAWTEPFEAARAVLAAEEPGGAPAWFDFAWWAGVLGRLHVNTFRVDALGVADFASLRAMAAGGAPGGAGGLGGGSGNGTAAYVVASFLNHSCEPPLVQSFAGADHRISFTAARDIAEGEQLFTAYVDVEAPREARRGRLKWAYGFDCACPKCLDGD